MSVQPYLFFAGRCEEALDYYRRALGAEDGMVLRWKDCPEPADRRPPGVKDNMIMHARLRIGDTSILASDGCGEGEPSFKGIALSLTAADDAEAERRFNALADGGQVQMPLTKTFFSSSFGMVADRFGVTWMVYVAPAEG